MLKSVKTADAADQLSRTLLRTLQGTTNRTKEAVDQLRQLYLLQCASRFNVVLPDILVKTLYSILSEPQQGPLKVRQLCFLILCENGVCKAMRIDSFDPPVDRKQIPLMVPLLSSCISANSARKHGSTLARWIAGAEADIRLASLASLFSLCSVSDQLLTTSQADSIDVWIREWLRNASNITAASGAAASSSSWFSRSSSSAVVTELDGSGISDFFTVFNQTTQYAPDQLLNVYAFSGLRSWISCHFSSHALTKRKMDADFAEVVLKYAIRLVEQSEALFALGDVRTTGVDTTVVESVLVEVVLLFDELCAIDSGLVGRLLPLIKRVYNSNVTSRLQSGSLYLAALRFFLNHSATVSYSPQAAFSTFFQGHVNYNYFNDVVGYETMRFLVSHREALLAKTEVFPRYLPPILKLVAWSPWALGSDLLTLIPYMSSPDSYVELFHTLLDLPLIAAGLEKTLASGGQLDSEMAMSGNPMFRAVLNTVLRNESSLGNINFWSNTTMPLLQEFCATNSPTTRVKACCELVPHCLRVFLDTLIRDGKESQLEYIVGVLIERYMQLYFLPAFQVAVRGVLVDFVLAIFAMHSRFVYTLRKPILAFLDSRHDEQREELKLNLCWIVGEYASPTTHERITGEIIFEYFQAIEPLAYEANMALTALDSTASEALSVSGSARTPRLLTTMMSTMAKLAARSQDITPRVTICLAKIVKLQRNSKSDAAAVLTQRANELIRILKYPTIAAAILDPPRESARPGLSHIDRHSSLPLLLQPQATDIFRDGSYVDATSTISMAELHPFLLA